MFEQDKPQLKPRNPRSRTKTTGLTWVLPPALVILRPVNALIAGAGVLLGAACLPGNYPWLTALLGFWAMAALAAGGNAENDFMDLAIDRRNRPDRPLPSGQLRPGMALALGYGGYGLGLMTAFAISLAHGFLVSGMVLLLILYNRNLKRRPLWGNLAVSLLCALAVILPEWPAWPHATGLAALFAFLTTLVRELLKDLEDMPGDREQGLGTAPIAWGERKVIVLVQVLIGLIVVILPLPYVIWHWPRAYAVLAFMGPAPLLFGIGLQLSRTKPDVAKLQRRMKVVMLTGLLALLVGALWRRFS
jgi:geranylgeranylglycerol-phosphate geranylgeranyltransferase